MTRLVLALNVVAMLATAEPVAAQQWPQWRGPNGLGVSEETGIPTTWSSDDGIAWRAPLEGASTVTRWTT